MNLKLLSIYIGTRQAEILRTLARYNRPKAFPGILFLNKLLEDLYDHVFWSPFCLASVSDISFSPFDLSFLPKKLFCQEKKRNAYDYTKNIDA